MSANARIIRAKTIQPKLDARILDAVVCPVCYGVLSVDSAGNEITCAGCGRVYPVIDGIPVLIPNRAKLLP